MRLTLRLIVAPPVVPVKEMTDEELKKTYGIHLASRLQSDDTGKETKWADEDDDDDWVPEAIEWNDGKVPLQPDNPAPTPTTTAPASIEPTSAPSVPVSASIVSPPSFNVLAPVLPKTPEKETTERAPEKTNEPKILVFSTRDTTKVTDSSDKGAVKDAPPPRASPWAPVSHPSTMPLPIPRAESRTSDYAESQQSSREVHADDFNRSWRDRPMNNRELFNSETGQLEPVQDRRNRGHRDPRTGLQLNKTQVLQRPPSQALGPAEPSPAFQQSRTGPYRQDDYGRRRTSSNVSGGSGSVGRRLSFNKGMYGLEHPLTPEDGAFSPRNPPPEATQQPQPPTAAGESLTPQSATVSITAAVPVTVAVPVTATIPETAAVPVTAPTVDYEDPVVKQQRIMKEARELARKRRQEEEEREEAAKRERLKIKLMALEQKEAEAKAAAEAAKALAEEQAAAAAAAKEIAAATAATQQSYHSQLLPTVNSEPSSISLASNSQPSNLDNSTMATAVLPSPQTSMYAPNAPYKPGAYGGRSPTKTFSSPHPSDYPRSPVRTYVMPANRDPKDQAWKGTQSSNDRYSNWGHQNKTQQLSSNRASPWGPVGEKSRYPALDGVRNGTFEPQQYSPYGRQDLSASTPFSPNTSIPQSDRGGTISDRSERGISPSKPSESTSVIPRAQPTPSGPSTASPSEPRAPVNHWASYPARLQQEEAETREQIRRQKEAAGPVDLQSSPIQIDETWRKVDLDTSGSIPRRILDSGILEEAKIPNGLSGQTQDRHPHQIPTGPASGRQTSRFFPAPQSSNLVDTPQQPPPEESALARLRAAPASPPPPTCIVNDVHGEHPIPSVRLPPPPPTTAGDSPVSRTNGHPKFETPKSPRGSGLDAFEAVQMNIQAMIQKQKEQQQTSPTKSFASPTKSFASPVKNREISVAPTTHTKPVYDDARAPYQRKTTTVALPPNFEENQGVMIVDIQPEDACTKPNEEDLLAELFVQDFGSKPTVRLSNVPHHTTFIPAPLPTTKGKYANRIPKFFAFSAQMYDHFTVKDFTKDGARFIPVRLPSSNEMKEIPCNFPTPQPKPKRPNGSSNNRKPRGNNNSYGRDPHMGSGYGNSRHSFRPGPSRAMADPVQ